MFQKATSLSPLSWMNIKLGALNQFAKLLANALDLPDPSSVTDKGEKAVFDSQVDHGLEGLRKLLK